MLVGGIFGWLWLLSVGWWHFWLFAFELWLVSICSGLFFRCLVDGHGWSLLVSKIVRCLAFGAVWQVPAHSTQPAKGGLFKSRMWHHNLLCEPRPPHLRRIPICRSLLPWNGRRSEMWRKRTAWEDLDMPVASADRKQKKLNPVFASHTRTLYVQVSFVRMLMFRWQLSSS